jgi:tetratricopeptide (TPR) repeat protein
MVLSGLVEESQEASEEMLIEVQEELEEHILERLTALEDGLRHLSSAVGATAEQMAQLEHNLTVTYAGVQTLSNVLETQGIVSRAEVIDDWERTVGRELLSRDLSRRLHERSHRILSLAAHSGDASTEFTRRLRALELALVGQQAEQAGQLMNDLVRLSPDNDELWSFVGEAAFETGDLASARIAFARVLELRGPHYETLIYLGTVLSDLGELEQAEEMLTAALHMAPDAFLPHFTLGALSALRNDHRTAVRHLTAAVDREQIPEAMHLLGVSHLQLHQTGRAINALRRAVELQPDFEDALYQLGVAYLRRGWSRLAMEAFQQVLRLDPQRLQYQETVRLLTAHEPTDLPENVAHLVRRAEQALEEGRPGDAYGLFATAAADAPDATDLQATAALLASALGRNREAVRFAHGLLRQSEQGSPYQAAAVVALLESLRHAGRSRAARRIATSLYRDSDDQLARGMAAYELALIEAEAGKDMDRARDLAREALEHTPRELRHYPLAVLGAVALKRSRFREALQYLEQAVELAPQPQLQRQLAVARLGTGDAEGAEEALAAANGDHGGGLNEELLGLVRRLGGLVDNLTRRKAVLSSAREGTRKVARRSTPRASTK